MIKEEEEQEEYKKEGYDEIYKMVKGLQGML